MFERKNVLVTGSTRNTGWGIARVFGRYGATVFVNGRAEADVHRAIESLRADPEAARGDFLPAAGDLARDDQTSAIFDAIADRGGIDVLVNNACHLGLGHSFLEMPMRFFDEVIGVNLRSYCLCMQLAARQMLDKAAGAIVSIGSNTTHHTIRDRAAYIASKGGVEALTRAAALELAEHKIRVNCVIAGYIHTERWNTLDETVKQRRRRNVPLGKESTGEDIGEAAAFLASERARNITGECLTVSGGIDIQMVPPDCEM